MKEKKRVILYFQLNQSVLLYKPITISSTLVSSNKFQAGNQKNEG